MRPKEYEVHGSLNAHAYKKVVHFLWNQVQHNIGYLEFQHKASGGRPDAGAKRRTRFILAEAVSQRPMLWEDIPLTTDGAGVWLKSPKAEGSEH